jgi:hypothetical protein
MSSLPVGRRGALAFILSLAFLGLTAAQIQEAPAAGEKAPQAVWGEYGSRINNTPGNSPSKIPASSAWIIIICWYGRTGAAAISRSGRKVARPRPEDLSREIIFIATSAESTTT